MITAAAHGLSGSDVRTVIVYVLASIIGAGILWSAPKLAKGFRMMTRMHGDFVGEPARPGVPARAGVMERLESQDTVLAQVQATQVTQGGQLAGVQEQLTAVVDELPKNGVPVAVKLDKLWQKYLTDEERTGT